MIKSSANISSKLLNSPHVQDSASVAAFKGENQDLDTKALVKFCAHGKIEAYEPPSNTAGSATHAGGKKGCGALLMQVDWSIQESIKRRENNGGGLFPNSSAESPAMSQEAVVWMCSSTTHGRRVEETPHHFREDPEVNITHTD